MKVLIRIKDYAEEREIFGEKFKSGTVATQIEMDNPTQKQIILAFQELRDKLEELKNE